MGAATGAALRDAGIATAIAHAEAVSPGWADDAYLHLLDFMALRKRSVTPEFLTEEARQYASNAGLPAPPDGRAWGGVITRARNGHKIKRVGFRESEDPKSHRAPVSVWRVL